MLLHDISRAIQHLPQFFSLIQKKTAYIFHLNTIIHFCNKMLGNKVLIYQYMWTKP